MYRTSALFLTLAFCCAVVAGPAHASGEDKAAKRAKICAKAEKRYQKFFGKSSADEDVTVVTMYKYNFCPRELTVKKGTTVRWVNVDSRTSHSVWFKLAGKPESDRLFSEEKVEMTFDMPAGEYPYLCGPHHEEDDMIGTVTVVD